MTIVMDDNTITDALAIVEKYEAFVRYLYPILQRSPRRHGVLRDTVLAALFVPVGGLYHAAKSRQVSRLHAVDAEFATLRSHLRFLALASIRIWPTHKLLRRDSVIRARRKIAAYRAAGDLVRLRQFLGAWLGHAQWADSANLIKSLGLIARPLR